MRRGDQKRVRNRKPYCNVCGVRRPKYGYCEDCRELLRWIAAIHGDCYREGKPERITEEMLQGMAERARNGSPLFEEAT